MRAGPIRYATLVSCLIKKEIIQGYSTVKRSDVPCMVICMP